MPSKASHARTMATSVCADLRPEDEAARVEPVGEHAGEEAEERERQELHERHHADRDRRACGYCGDFVSSRTYQASAIRCIHAPICDVSWPAKKSR